MIPPPRQSNWWPPARPSSRRQRKYWASRKSPFCATWTASLRSTSPFRREIVQVIRRGRPDVVLTFDPWQRYQIHPDHRAIGQTTLDAVAAARDRLYYPEQLTGGLTEHRVHNVYFFATDCPNYYVDITTTIDRRSRRSSATPARSAGARLASPYGRGRGQREPRWGSNTPRRSTICR